MNPDPSDHDHLAHDLGPRLDDALGAQPALPPPSEWATRGRRALRRRRAVRSVAGVAALAVIGGGVTWSLTGASATGTGVRTDDGLVATAPTTDPCPVLRRDTSPDSPDLDLPRHRTTSAPLRAGASPMPIEADDDGTYRVRDGLSVLQYLPGATVEGRRWATFEIEASDGRFYISLDTATGPDGTDGSARYADVTPARGTLQEWTTFQRAVRPGDPGDLVTIQDDGTLVGRDGVEVLEQRAVRIDGFGQGTGPGERADVSVARVRRGENACFVLSRHQAIPADDGAAPDGEAYEQVFVVPPEYAGADLDAFVAQAEGVYGNVRW